MKTNSTRPRVIALLRIFAAEKAAHYRAGLNRQQSVIDRTVTAHNLDVVRTVKLVDVPGNNVLLNPEIQSILRAIEAHEIDGVVAADLDRLIRAKDLALLSALDVFKKAKAKLYTGGHVHDFNSSEVIYMLHISASVAGLEMRTLRERIQSGKEIKRKAGKCPSSARTLPFGVTYNRQTERWIYILDRVAAVQEAFRQIDEDGHTNISAIARTVGISRSTLNSLLRNPIYSGWRVYGKLSPTSDKEPQRAKIIRNEAVRVKVFDEPAVSQERFDRVQTILKNKSASQNRKLNYDQ